MVVIVDWMKNAECYKPLDPRISEGLHLLEQLDKLDLDPGWHTADNGIAYLIQESDTVPVNNNMWEAHRHTTDIQFILMGEEYFGYTDTSLLGERTKAYDPEDDIEYFKGTGDFVTLKPGMFAIQFPHDAHLPGSHNGKSGYLRRGVIKLPWG